MIEFYAQGQRLTFYTPVVAADSLNYLTAHAFFSPEWNGYTRWLHFRKGETEYDIELDENDDITADDSLNLTVGEWEIYAHGTMDEARLTTIPVILTVKESGLIDGPLHALPQTVAERLDFKASQAMLLAQAVKDAADRGDFDGKDGTGLAIVGYFDTLEELEATITHPVKGEMYGVGYSDPYDIYGYDFEGGAGWKNNGPTQGVPGQQGERGVTFTPSVDDYGFISWTNDGGLENPTTRDIRGPTGSAGATGPAGTSAYEAAVAGGYTGTPDTFNDAMSAFPYHNARHLPTGSDPISVQTGNLADGAVTQAKLAANAVSSVYTTTLTTGSWTSSGGIYYKTFQVSGLTGNDNPIIDVNYLDESMDADKYQKVKKWHAAFIGAETGNGTLTVYATESPLANVPLRLLCIRR